MAKDKIVKKSDASRDIKDFVFESQSFTSTGAEQGRPLAGGGRISIRVANQKVAAQILKRYRSNIGFWQAARQFAIKKGRVKAIHTTGFSKPRKANQNSETEILRALDETAVNAIRQLGYSFSYEKQAPDYVKPTTKASFTLIIWFTGESKQTFLG